jgi:dCTP deaminase
MPASERLPQVFTEPSFWPAQQPAQGTGLLPYQALAELVRAKEIWSPVDIDREQIQPASLDLRLGPIAYRVRASFLPGASVPVKTKIEQLGMHEIDLQAGAVLERGCVYIVPLLEQLALSSRLSGLVNPKSSTGRLDVFTRLLTDRASGFDRIAAGYKGPLYLEIAPRTFSVKVRQGDRLAQIRIRRGSPQTSGAALRRLLGQVRLIDAEPGKENIRDDSIAVSLDLKGDPATRLIGFRAKPHSEVIDVSKRGFYDPVDFWEPISSRPEKGIVLNPGDFYILATKEAVIVPPDHAAEMLAFDAMVGEFRVHYAGFFDPGFGYSADGRPGAKAVLEVRSHDVPFLLEHEQTMGWLRFERLTDRPDRLYGLHIGSSYQGQGLMLAKQFKPFA